MASNIEVMDRGMTCLLEKLGEVETEQFISLIIRERFDYTKWQRQKFDQMTAEEFTAAAVEYSKKTPFYKK